MLDNVRLCIVIVTKKIKNKYGVRVIAFVAGLVN